jgi:hypothetical protein
MIERNGMTLKISKKPPQRKTKPSTTGWHSLDTDQLLLWAYMWLERMENSRFSEPVRQWALRLHTNPTTLSERTQGLLRCNVIVADGKNDGWKTKALYTVTEPPTSVLRFAEAWWDVEVDRGKTLPVRKSVHGEARINSGAPRVRKSEHITTTSEQHHYRSESQNVFSNRTLSIDSVGVRKSVHGETRINTGAPRVRNSEHERLEGQLADAEKKLERLLAEYGPSETITKVQQSRVADLTAKIQAIRGGTDER